MEPASPHIFPPKVPLDPPPVEAVHATQAEQKLGHSAPRLSTPSSRQVFLSARVARGGQWSLKASQDDPSSGRRPAHAGPPFSQGATAARRLSLFFNVLVESLFRPSCIASSCVVALTLLPQSSATDSEE